MESKLVGLLRAALRKHDRGATLLVEASKGSFDADNAATLGILTSSGMEGLYICVRKPLDDICTALKKGRFDRSRVVFLEVTDSPSKASKEQCTTIAVPKSASELIRAIQSAMGGLRGAKKFIYMDSIDALCAMMPLPEIMKVTEFLRRVNQKREAEYVILAFVEEFPQKRFIRDVAVHADEYVTASGG